MSADTQPSERASPPSAIVLTALVSLFLHVILVASVAVFAHSAGVRVLPEEFSISLEHPPLDTSYLPPLAGSRDTGPLQAIPIQEAQPIESPQIAKEDTEEPQKKESEPKREEPKQEAVKKPEETRKPTQEEKPAEKKPEPQKEPKAEQKTTEVISTRGSEQPADEKAESSPPSPRQLRESLQSRDDVLSASRNVAGGQVSQHVAMEGDSGGGVPDTIRKTLMALIWQNWNPPFVPLGEIKEAVVEFTLYSPPVPKDAVNQNRPRSKLTSIEIVKGSGDSEFDKSALEAIKRVQTLQLPPLPQYYTHSRLVVSCRFYYIGDRN